MRKPTAVLKFKANDVRILLDHAKSCTMHSPTFEQMFDPAYRVDGKEVPEGADFPTAKDVDNSLVPFGLLLVADQGVYIMSNGEPRDIVTPHPEDPMKGTSRVVYAEGISPGTNEFDDWWERKRAAMGGDDQGLFLNGDDVEEALASRTKNGFLEVRVKNNTQYVTEVSF